MLLRNVVRGGAGCGVGYVGWLVATERPVAESDFGPKWDGPEVARYWGERPIATVKRAAVIASELGPLVAQCGVDYALSRLGDAEVQAARAIWLREALTRLGPAFVKLGQSLSIRPDVVPAAALQQLRSLCDAVEPISTKAAIAVLEAELGVGAASRLFLDLTEETPPVASASLGQVYKCTTRGSKECVAVKIQRPEIISRVCLDLHLLRCWCRFVEFLKSMGKDARPYDVALIDAFARGAWGELDYVCEAQNQTRMRLALAKAPSRRLRQDVYIPPVFDSMTTRKVLTTTWVHGDQLCRASDAEIQRLVPLGVELFIWQLLDEGRFHCDPHPGNLLVRGKQLALIDFGLCSEIAQPDAVAMTQAVVHLIEGDVPGLLEDAITLDFLPPDVDKETLIPVLQKVFDDAQIAATAFDDLDSASYHAVRRRRKNFIAVSDQLNDVFFNYPFSVPAYFALITRALVILEGIALTGDPDFDLFKAAYPHALKRAREIFGTEGLIRITTKAAKNKFTPASSSPPRKHHDPSFATAIPKSSPSS